VSKQTVSLPSRRIHVIDSHTGGEPTRIVVSGGPELGSGPLSERLVRFREQHDDFRRAVVNEPRGSDVLVGGLLCEPTDPTNLAGVIFFNNVGFLGMCGHGTIGLITTLAHMGKLTMPLNRIETPVGVVTTKVEEDGSVTVENVPSYRYRAAVSVDVHGYGKVTGDVAWGGNWFFLVGDHGMELKSTNIDALTECSWAIRHALESNGITGENGAEIDHIELFTPSPNSQANSRNFVLCPGGAYDRSPCGTGTSAKLACLSAAGQLKPGETWRQESVIGSVFEGRFTLAASHPTLSAQRIVPSITGTAFVTAEADLIVNSQDPFGMGIPQ